MGAHTNMVSLAVSVVVALVVVNSVASTPLTSLSKVDIETKFKAWMNKYSVEFEDDVEYLRRQGIFADNLKRIEEHNRGNHSWTMGANKFAHLTAAEFKEKYIGHGILPPLPERYSVGPRTQFVFNASAPRASSVDWVAQGAVNTPMAQENCGGCWSFSTTGAMEGAYYIKNKVLKKFSEQQLVSCDTTNDGCGGGVMDYAFKWIHDTGGICLESDYPYVSQGGTAPACDSNKCALVPGTKVTNYVDVSPNPQRTPCTDEAMEQALMQQPQSIAIEADQDHFQLYTGGVMTHDCGVKLDHGVLAVGFGEDNGDAYYKVKNSWGPDWGEEGYIRLGKGSHWGIPYNEGEGQCGLLLSVSFPEL